MSPVENLQATSTSARKSVDSFLLGFILAVSTAVGLGAAGIL